MSATTERIDHWPLPSPSLIRFIRGIRDIGGSSSSTCGPKGLGEDLKGRTTEDTDATTLVPGAAQGMACRHADSRSDRGWPGGRRPQGVTAFDESPIAQAIGYLAITDLRPAPLRG